MSRLHASHVWYALSRYTLLLPLAWVVLGAPLPFEAGFYLDTVARIVTAAVPAAASLGLVWIASRLATREVAAVLAQIERGVSPDRPVFLFLRSFETGRSTITMRLGSAFFRGLGVLRQDRYDAEQALATAVGGRAWLVAIGDKTLSFGAAKLRVPDSAWQDVFENLARVASGIFVLPGPSEAVIWEVGQIIERPEWQAKALFVMPREGTHSISGTHADLRSWEETIGRISRQVGIRLPHYDPKGAFIAVADGRVIGTMPLEVFTQGLAKALRTSVGEPIKSVVQHALRGQRDGLR